MNSKEVLDDCSSLVIERELARPLWIASYPKLAGR
jgi:hypothetical protein